jgi:hypothetical protein
MDIKFTQKHLLKRFSFLQHVFGTFLKSQMAVKVWAYFGYSLYIIPLVYVSLSVLGPYVFQLLILPNLLSLFV